MMLYSQLNKLLVMLLLLVMSANYANALDEEPHAFLPTQAKHASFVFSGVVTNELGEHYGYFFQMQRDNEQFHSLAALFDGQNKQVLLFDEDHAIIQDPASYDWHVGRAFLKFNAINDSWIFGLQSHEKKGFNFKVDLLNQTPNLPIKQTMHVDTESLVSQASRLNGHMQLGNGAKEQFVTAKNAWFRQLWSVGKEASPLTGVLCRFNDDSGFYSVNLMKDKTKRAVIAGWRDEHGMPSAMSQHIQVKQASDGQWHIYTTSPHLHLVLANAIQQNSVVAGFIKEGKKTGFCMLNDIPNKQPGSSEK